jgi:hypothetical protein
MAPRSYTKISNFEINYTLSFACSRQPYINALREKVLVFSLFKLKCSEACAHIHYCACWFLYVSTIL